MSNSRRFSKIWRKYENTILTAYIGTRIEQFDVVTIPCQYSHGRWYDTKFFLVDTEGPGILGLPSLRQHDLVTLHCAVQADEQKVQSNENSGDHIDDLLKQYPNQFDCIGIYHGEHYIVTDPQVQPVIHAPRKCPIQLKD